jgi:outer membrane biosynthesis protein TonB
MDRAEATGLGVATAGHLALLAALSLGFAASRLPPPRNDPIEVSFVEEAAPASTAPAPAAEAPAPRLAEVDAPLAPAPPPLPRPQAVPTPAPPQAAPPPPAPVRQATPKPQPAPLKAAAPAAPKPAPSRRAPPKAAPRPAGGRLVGLLAGLSDRDSPSRSTAPQAVAAGPAVEASLSAEVKRQLKPHWQRVVPSGAEVESLKTVVTIHLERDGRVTGISDVRTTGITPSNRPQVALHQERAKKAVMLASPFRLPAEYYDAWKEITATLDLRLSQ